jgi:molecular chaperone GrpE
MADEPISPASQNDADPPADVEAAGEQADPVAQLAAENADLKDRLLRAVAEMENLRKRTEREIGDTRQYAVSSFAREVLTVGDNLRRALDAVPQDARNSADSVWAALLEGMELTGRELLKILGKHGVRVVEPAGERFDPNLHQAMFEVADDSVPSGTIVNVIQPGYMIGERVLRPAMVSVAKGGPRASRPTADAAASGKDSE